MGGASWSPITHRVMGSPWETLRAMIADAGWVEDDLRRLGLLD
jgi:hypothetical protein